jgi:hypothetical protein
LKDEGFIQAESTRDVDAGLLAAGEVSCAISDLATATGPSRV